MLGTFLEHGRLTSPVAVARRPYGGLRASVEIPLILYGVLPQEVSQLAAQVIDAVVILADALADRAGQEVIDGRHELVDPAGGCYRFPGPVRPGWCCSEQRCLTGPLCAVSSLDPRQLELARIRGVEDQAEVNTTAQLGRHEREIRAPAIHQECCQS